MAQKAGTHKAGTHKAGTQQITKQRFVTEESNIGEVVERYGWKAADIMQGYGLHCIGCHASSFDTIGQGMRLHGMTDEDIGNLLKDINNAIAASEKEKRAVNTGASGKTIAVTDRAAAKIQALLVKESKDGFALRIEVVEGGCAGMSYRLFFEQNVGSDDHVVEKDGIRVCADRKSMEHLAGSTIDFVDGLQESGFKIDNPNAQANCSCGKSFA